LLTDRLTNKHRALRNILSGRNRISYQTVEVNQELNSVVRLANLTITEVKRVSEAKRKECDAMKE